MPVRNPQSGRSGFMPILLTAIATFFLTIFTLSATHALAFTPSDVISGIVQVKRSTWDQVARGFWLLVLPQGHSWGLDADSVDGLHAVSFALSKDLDSFSSATSGKLSSLSLELADLGGSIRTGELASFFQNASNLVSGTISDSRLSSNVALLNNSQTFTGPKTFSSGTLTVAAGTTLSLSKGSLLDVQGSLSLPPGSITTVDLADSSVTSLKILDGTIVNADVSSSASIAYSKLNLGGSITGSDLSPSIAITTSGAISAGSGVSSSSSLSTSGSGTLSIAGASTLSSTLSVSGASSLSSTLNVLGASTLAGTTVGNLTSTTGLFTSSVADSSSAIAFNLATATAYATVGDKLLSLKNLSTEVLSINKDGLLTLNGNLVSTGTLQGTQLISTVTTGTAPLVVSSTTQVANLNASFLEGNNSATLLSQPQPNLVLNSDFGRRSKWMTFMPETFTDTNSGLTQWEGTNGVGTVASNILTANGTDTPWGIHWGFGVWRDVRISAQFKAINTGAVVYRLEKWADANNWVAVDWNNGSFELKTLLAGIGGQVSVASQALTLNNWYWFELEAQGTTYIVKLYSSGASPVAKSSATLLQTLSGTVSSSAVTTGYIGIETSAVTSSQWGGLGTGDGGVYVEGWGPESWTPTFIGTKGGQAIGFDESAAAGPIGKQWAMRAYIPATSREILLDQLIPSGAISTSDLTPSTTYAFSYYVKTSGLGGSGTMVQGVAYSYKQDGTNDTFVTLNDAAETAWTRKTATLTTGALGVQHANRFDINSGSTRTGTAFFLLPQLEQGSVATPWRNAPADDDPILWMIQGKNNSNYTIGATNAMTEIDPRDTSINVFLPWDSSLTLEGDANWNNSATSNNNYMAILADGLGPSNGGPRGEVFEFLNGVQKHVHFGTYYSLTSGKHRLALAWQNDSGVVTSTIYAHDYGTGSYGPTLVIIAHKGRGTTSAGGN